MVINPTTTVKLFSGVPLDNTYTNTLYFASLADQLAYFNSLTPVKTFTSQMYQRVNAGIFEANCKADDIYNCNYMMFQNAGFGNKWFFAFVNSVEYVNNNNARVTFEIDVIQTWLFDVEREQCLVERCHSVTDNIGDNILPEPVATGEYVFADYGTLAPEQSTLFNEWLIAVEYSDVTAASVDGNVYDGVYNGATIGVFNTSAGGIAGLNALLDNFIQKPEGILMIYMIPKFAVGGDAPLIPDEGARLATTYKGKTAGIIRTGITGSESFDGYVPHNKKLYTYPYNFYHVDNGDGNGMELRYEFFSNPASMHFHLSTTVTPPVQIKLIPNNYKGAVDNESEFLTITNLPVGGWNYDTYKAWQAQNSVPIALKVGAGVLGLGIGLATGGVGLALGIGSALSMATSVASESYQASIQADVTKGNFSSANVNFAQGKSQFFAGRCHIPRDYAIQADKFFDRFGYKSGRIMLPPRANRPHWTYVKTIGCEIKGNCPADDIKRICAIYDSGITWWRNPAEVGNYSLDNSPV